MRKCFRVVAALAAVTVMTMTSVITSGASGWKQDSNGWWFENADGTYVSNMWKQIDGKWYTFDNHGYMRTGWFQENQTWYYLDNSGEMQTGWVKENGKWYYLNNSGAMQTGWIKESGKWYYLNSSGVMQTGWIKENAKWYYLAIDGSCYINTITPDGYIVNANGEWIEFDFLEDYDVEENYETKKESTKKEESVTKPEETTTEEETITKPEEETTEEETTTKPEETTTEEETTTKLEETTEEETTTKPEETTTEEETTTKPEETTTEEETTTKPEETTTETELSELKVYNAIISKKSEYPEGKKWTNDNFYKWKGGIYSGGYGCVGFAFLLSDAAFGDLPAKKYEKYDASAIKVGDIIRINNDTHSVIVLTVDENGVTVAEGNYNSSIHWGRSFTHEQLSNATYILTRY